MRKVMRICLQLALTAAVAAGATLQGCDLIYDDGGECPETSYSVSLLYDMNMEWADAFAAQVKSLSLYAFGTDGVLAYKKTEEVSALSGQSMDISDIDPGTYTLVVWAEGEEATSGSWIYSSATLGSTTLDVLTCSVNSEDGEADFELTPLFHGMAEGATFAELEEGGTVSVEVDLTKDTNSLLVMLQNTSGEEISAEDFSFEVTDTNGSLSYDNTPLGEAVTYRPWAAYSASAGMDDDEDEDDSTKGEGSTAITKDGDEDDTVVNTAIAEFSLGRLTEDSEARLRVYNSDGERVLSIPLVDFALLVKGYSNASLTDQEYLDRQSSYSMVFFLDEGGNWLSSTVIINSWRVVLSTVDM